MLWENQYSEFHIKDILNHINIVSNFWCEQPYTKSNWFIILSFIQL